MTKEEDLWVILDLRGLILHMYHSGTDREATTDEEGNVLKTPGHTVSSFSTRYLLLILDLVPANRIIAVNDAGNEYRKAIYPEYKGNRKPLIDSVRQSVKESQEAVRQLLHSVGVPQVSVAGTEADDVIAYFEQHLPGNKLIYTVDGDLTAMCKKSTKVFLKGVLTEDFKGVKPEHVTLYKSLVGDTSDNYKGVKGFGPKAWETLVEEYKEEGLLELTQIIENQDLRTLQGILEAEPGQHKLLQKICDNWSAWATSYEVALLHPELVDQRYGKEFRRLRWDKRVPSRERLVKLAQEIGAMYLLPDYANYLPTQTLITKSDWDDSVLGEAKQLFEQSRYISLDYETWSPKNANFDKASDGRTYVDMYDSRIAGMGITCGRNLEHTFYFAFDHADEENNTSKEHIVELLNQRPEGMPLIIQNTYFEQSVSMEDLGIKLEPCYDTKVMASHIAEHDTTGLKDLSKRWMNYDQIKYKDVIEKGRTMKDYSSSHVFQYGADDPLITAHLFDLFYTIMQVEGTWDFVKENEFDFVDVLSDSYIAGVSVDWDEVERQHKEDANTFANEIKTIRGELSNHEAEGLDVWVGEQQLNFDADTRQLIQQLNKIANDNPPENFEQVIKGNKNLHLELADGLSCDSTLEEMTDFLQESRAVKRLTIQKKVLGKIIYKDYSETESEAKFSFRGSSIRILANKLGLPDTPTELTEETLSSYRAEAAFSPEAEDFLNNVSAVINTPKAKRSKCPEYKALAETYRQVADKKIRKDGTELNLNSPVQQQELFYGMLGLPIRLRSLDVSETRQLKGLPGSPQTNEDAVRTAIAFGDAPEGSWKRTVLDALTTAKKADTRIKLFYSKLPLWKHPKDGLVHPQFNSVGTETRRPSGSSPNLLQLSKKGEGVKVRRCFIPNQKLGHDLIVTIDWSAQELRVIAGLSGDKQLTACYVGDDLLDVHSLTGAGIAGISYDEFMAIRRDTNHPQHKAMDDVRKKAKNVNFGSSYGIGAAKLARQLLCDPETAKEYLTAKKRTYPGIEEWRAEIISELHGRGYVATRYGSRKHVFNLLNNPDEGLVAYYERAAVNFLIQGVCADYLKTVLAKINKQKVFKRHGAVLIAPVYDELVISCHSSQAVTLIHEVYKIMVEGVKGVPIPMLAPPALGVNFADQIEILEDENDTLTDEKILIAIDKAFGTEQREAA